MAYSSTNPIMLLQDGFSPGMPKVWIYASSHGSSEIIATGFFTGCGYGSRSSSNPSTSGFANVCPGLNIGDIVLSRASTNPNTGSAGHCGIHSITASTPNVASTSLSSGFNAAYDCTISAST